MSSSIDFLIPFGDFAESDPTVKLWTFVVYSFVIVFSASLYLFYINRGAGFLFSYLITLYTWRRFQGWISIESIGLIPLGGKIVFHNFKYTCVDFTISAVKGYIEFQFWTKYGSQPFIKIQADGLEYFIFNRVSAYEAILNMMTNVSTAGEPHTERNAHNDTPTAVSPSSLKTFLRCIEICGTNGACYAGNSDLPNIAIFQYAKLSCTYQLLNGHEVEPTNAYFENARVTLKPNVEYRDLPLNQARRQRHIHQQKTWRQFFTSILFPAPHTNYDEAFPLRDESLWQGLSRYREDNMAYQKGDEYAVVHEVMTAKTLKLQFMTGNADNHLNVFASALVVTYGAWAHRERKTIQEYFFPPSYRSGSVESSTPTLFKCTCFLDDTTSIKLPTRQPSMDKFLPLDSQESPRPYGWIHFKATSPSELKLSIPYSSAGLAETHVGLSLKECEVLTSVNSVPFITTTTLEVDVSYKSSTDWNGPTMWDIQLSLPDPNSDIFLLREHTYLVGDLISDFNAGPSPPPEYFAPSSLKILLNLEYSSVYLNITEQNIVVNHNDLDSNAFLKIKLRQTELELKSSFDTYARQFNQFKLSLKTDKCSATVLDAYRPFFPYPTKNEISLIDVDRLHMEGSYTTFNTRLNAHPDRLKLDFKLFSPRLYVSGHILNWFENLSSNYWGRYSYSTKSKEGMSSVQDILDKSAPPASSFRLDIGCSFVFPRLNIPKFLPGLPARDGFVTVSATLMQFSLKYVVHDSSLGQRSVSLHSSDLNLEGLRISELSVIDSKMLTTTANGKTRTINTLKGAISSIEGELTFEFFRDALHAWKTLSQELKLHQNSVEQKTDQSLVWFKHVAFEEINASVRLDDRLTGIIHIPSGTELFTSNIQFLKPGISNYFFVPALDVFVSKRASTETSLAQLRFGSVWMLSCGSNLEQSQQEVFAKMSTDLTGSRYSRQIMDVSSATFSDFILNNTRGPVESHRESILIELEEFAKYENNSVKPGHVYLQSLATEIRIHSELFDDLTVFGGSVVEKARESTSILKRFATDAYLSNFENTPEMGIDDVSLLRKLYFDARNCQFRYITRGGFETRIQCVEGHLKEGVLNISECDFSVHYTNESSCVVSALTINAQAMSVQLDTQSDRKVVLSKGHVMICSEQIPLLSSYVSNVFKSIQCLQDLWKSYRQLQLVQIIGFLRGAQNLSSSLVDGSAEDVTVPLGLREAVKIYYSLRHLLNQATPLNQLYNSVSASDRSIVETETSPLKSVILKYITRSSPPTFKSSWIFCIEQTEMLMTSLQNKQKLASGFVSSSYLIASKRQDMWNLIVDSGATTIVIHPSLPHLIERMTETLTHASPTTKTIQTKLRLHLKVRSFAVVTEADNPGVEFGIRELDCSGVLDGSQLVTMSAGVLFEEAHLRFFPSNDFHIRESIPPCLIVLGLKLLFTGSSDMHHQKAVLKANISSIFTHFPKTLKEVPFFRSFLSLIQAGPRTPSTLTETKTRDILASVIVDSVNVVAEIPLDYNNSSFSVKYDVYGVNNVCRYTDNERRIWFETSVQEHRFSYADMSKKEDLIVTELPAWSCALEVAMKSRTVTADVVFLKPEVKLQQSVGLFLLSVFQQLRRVVLSFSQDHSSQHGGGTINAFDTKSQLLEQLKVNILTTDLTLITQLTDNISIMLKARHLGTAFGMILIDSKLNPSISFFGSQMALSLESLNFVLCKCSLDSTIQVVTSDNEVVIKGALKRTNIYAGRNLFLLLQKSSKEALIIRQNLDALQKQFEATTGTNLNHIQGKATESLHKLRFVSSVTIPEFSLFVVASDSVPDQDTRLSEPLPIGILSLYSTHVTTNQEASSFNIGRLEFGLVVTDTLPSTIDASSSISNATRFLFRNISASYRSRRNDVRFLEASLSSFLLNATKTTPTELINFSQYFTNGISSSSISVDPNAIHVLDEGSRWNLRFSMGSGLIQLCDGTNVFQEVQFPDVVLSIIQGGTYPSSDWLVRLNVHQTDNTIVLSSIDFIYDMLQHLQQQRSNNDLITSHSTQTSSGQILGTKFLGSSVTFFLVLEQSRIALVIPSLSEVAVDLSLQNVLMMARFRLNRGSRFADRIESAFVETKGLSFTLRHTYATDSIVSTKIAGVIFQLNSQRSLDHPQVAGNIAFRGVSLHLSLLEGTQNLAFEWLNTFKSHGLKPGNSKSQSLATLFKRIAISVSVESFDFILALPSPLSTIRLSLAHLQSHISLNSNHNGTQRYVFVGDITELNWSTDGALEASIKIPQLHTRCRLHRDENIQIEVTLPNLTTDCFFQSERILAIVLSKLHVMVDFGAAAGEKYSSKANIHLSQLGLIASAPTAINKIVDYLQRVVATLSFPSNGARHDKMVLSSLAPVVFEAFKNTILVDHFQLFLTNGSLLQADTLETFLTKLEFTLFQKQESPDIQSFLKWASISIRKNQYSSPLSKAEHRLWNARQWLSFTTTGAPVVILASPPLSIDIHLDSITSDHATAIEYDFKCFFSGPLEAALNPGLLKFVRDTFQLVSKSPVVRKENTGSTAATLRAKSPNSVNFQLKVMGDATPKDLLQSLGLSSDLIPTLLIRSVLLPMHAAHSSIASFLAFLLVRSTKKGGIDEDEDPEFYDCE